MERVSKKARTDETSISNALAARRSARQRNGSPCCCNNTYLAVETVAELGYTARDLVEVDGFAPAVAFQDVHGHDVESSAIVLYYVQFLSPIAVRQQIPSSILSDFLCQPGLMMVAVAGWLIIIGDEEGRAAAAICLRALFLSSLLFLLSAARVCGDGSRF